MFGLIALFACFKLHILALQRERVFGVFWFLLDYIGYSLIVIINYVMLEQMNVVDNLKDRGFSGRKIRRVNRNSNEEVRRHSLPWLSEGSGEGQVSEAVGGSSGTEE